MGQDNSSVDDAKRDYDDNDSAAISKDESRPETKFRPKATKKKTSDQAVWKKRLGVDDTLPPLSDINEIFMDITQNALNKGLEKCLRDLSGRPLNVATMCSGTESPLLALQLVARALQKLGKENLLINHCFSAEIEPYKQAYIERNFHPNIIFRDIREFTNKGKQAAVATTAYGSEVKIPGDVDILIAGFACVDRSALNNHKKVLAEKGETSDTFRAIVSYANVWRPRIVLLENVVGKTEHWEEYTDLWNDIGYECSYAKFDTKNFYLPQTRMRMYMLCIDRIQFGKGVEEAISSWSTVVKSFTRKASSPYADFTLPYDDYRVQHLRAEALKQAGDTMAPRKFNWEKCRGRHNQLRRSGNLGGERPLTDWVDGGSCTPPEYADKAWFKAQVERVWDNMDISLLRNAHPNRGSFDSQFKMRIWDLSQNVDYQQDTQPFGISPCLTPDGIPYMTDRGAKATGYDLLMLQGLPIEKMVFTTETDAQLQSLAGNAMSTTVVGVATLSALIIGIKALRRNKRPVSTGYTPGKDISQPKHIFMGEDLLYHRTLKPESRPCIDLARFIAEAQKSRSMCYCEGKGPFVSKVIKVCQLCQHTACVECAGKPAHDYKSPCVLFKDRMMPQDFEREWTHLLPTRVKFYTRADMPRTRKAWADVDSRIKEEYLGMVQYAFGQELRLQRFVRSSVWIVPYESPLGKLKLVLSDPPEWRFYVKAPACLPGNSMLRKVLEFHIARSTVSKHNIMDCSWEAFVPKPTISLISIKGSPEKRGSWHARIGLTEFKDEKVSCKLSISSANFSMAENDFAGEYELLQDCGTAKSSLYKRICSPTVSGDYGSMYLFLDPSPLGDPIDDCFVFSKNHNRIPWGEQREIVGRLDSSWRPWNDTCFGETQVNMDGRWAAFPLELQPTPTRIVMKSPLNMDIWAGASPIHNCSNSSTIISCEFDVPDNVEQIWRTRRYVCPDDKLFFSSFSFVLSKIQSIPWLEKWRRLTKIPNRRCQNCAPKTPCVKWNLNTGNKKKNSAIATPFEDHMEAGKYERALKSRAPIFTIEIEAKNAQDGHIKIGLNVQSLAHRALAKLGSIENSASVSWRLVIDAYPSMIKSFPRFNLKDNRDDKVFEAPLHMLIPLRREQRRSLTWMRAQESAQAPTFTLRAIEEASLPQLKWRAEACAESEFHVKGGVLADKVGYGKTITTIALIQLELQEKSAKMIIEENSSGYSSAQRMIEVAATLVIGPNNVTKQWRNEIIKFLGSEYATKILLIKEMKDLKVLTIQDFIEARFIIVCWKVLFDQEYISQLSQFAAMPKPITTKGRAFSAWLDYTLDRIPNNIKTLKDLGVLAFKDVLEHQVAENIHNPDFQAVVPSKRLKGKAYELSTQEKAPKTQVAPQPNLKAPVSKQHSNKSDWKTFKTPLFQLFRYNRLVVDEYPYLEETNLPAYTSITKLKAEKIWVLSGTPELQDFADVKRLATFFSINLGPDTETPGVITPKNLKRTRAEQTKTEEFLSFHESKSQHWHEQRHEHAQKFLDQFVRQNRAEIEAIPCYEILRPVRLHFNHRAIYAELLQHLQSRDMEMTRAPYASGSDRSSRINKVIEGCKTPEEALINCSSVFRCEGDMLSIREEQYTAISNRLERELLRAERLFRKCIDLDSHYLAWKKETIRHNPLGDSEAMELMVFFIKQAELRAQETTAHSNDRKSARRLRDLVGDIRISEREFLLHLRSTRYLKALQLVRQGISSISSDLASNNCDNARCRNSSANHYVLSVIPQCGHTACNACLEGRDDSTKCIVEHCDVYIQEMDPIEVNAMPGHDDVAQESNGGNKLESMINLLNRIHPTEQAILFVQNYNLMKEVACELASQHIKYYAINENSNKAADIIEEFQENEDVDTKKRILVLNVADENAAGVNLTAANHVLFLSPVLATTQLEYQARVEQAIGRARRYGQTRKVHVYHFVALNTIDVDIIERHYRRSNQLRESDELEHTNSAENPIYLNENLNAMESSRLVHDTMGRIALVPASWLLNREKAKIMNFDIDDLGVYGSLVTFSRTFANESPEG
ncbi:hypothetical protein AOQ84DRAFT_331743 [Glonium stellatum]|uniref:Helicase C-terminal domain-containing protein n=1 Tax=Glonium stellatum TaxID=574774 RepID=A0A8E2FBP9_9PEZI|nr:hypothetical protein AOQ84DRAFT_331743 [Glonium stellatum]